MAAKVICMASAKGGSGKTVLTATFGTFLVALGKKVLLVDTDASTNGLTLLHLKEVMLQAEFAIGAKREPRGIYESVSFILPPEIVHLNSGIDLIPATYKFVNTEDASLDDYQASLLHIVTAFKENYDYIFLDAQAGSDLYAQVAMNRKISDEVVIVSEYDPMSAAGVERLKGLLREDLVYTRTWVLLNKMLPDFVQSFSDFLEVAKYLSPIPWDADVVRAYARRRLALDLENGNDYTLAIMQTLRSLFDEELAEDIKTWADQKAATLRQPIRQQHEDLVAELAYVEQLYGEVNEAGANYTKSMVSSVMSFLAVVGIAMSLLSWSPNKTEQSANYIAYGVLVTGVAVSLSLILRAVSQWQNNNINLQVQERMLESQTTLRTRIDKLEALIRADSETILKSRKEIEKESKEHAR